MRTGSSQTEIKSSRSISENGWNLQRKEDWDWISNPTFFSHPMVVDNLTLSSPIEEVRNFWINHGKACIRISKYFAEELGVPLCHEHLDSGRL